MAFFGKSGLKISKKESADTTPYTLYYPHTVPHTERKWNQAWYQCISIDPAQKNYALRIERRYHNGWIVPIVFDKVAIASIVENEGVTICDTYQVLTSFLERYREFYKDCHFVVIERQLPQNYRATRIAQHTISYFSIALHNAPLLPTIIEVSAKLKGKILGAPKRTVDDQLKKWAIIVGRELLTLRKDTFSLQVLNNFSSKQDDLCDTICQLEALFILWGFPATSAPPDTINSISTQSVPLVLQIAPNMCASKLETTDILLQTGPCTAPFMDSEFLTLIPQSNTHLDDNEEHISSELDESPTVTLDTIAPKKHGLTLQIMM